MEGVTSAATPTCRVLCRWEIVLLARWLGTQKLATVAVEDKYVYYENVSKQAASCEEQSSSINACPEAGERCPVHILDKYIAKLPLEANSTFDRFYQ